MSTAPSQQRTRAAGTTNSTTGSGAPGSLAKAIAVGAAGSVLVNASIAAVARGPLDASDALQPLDPPVFIMWTVLGVVIGAVGWRLIRNRAQQPTRLLRWLVPAVLVVSLLPDLWLYVSDSMPGTSGTAVLALVAMHLATAAIAVTAYRRFLPVH